MVNDFTLLDTPASWAILLVTCGLSLYTMFRNRSLLERLMFSPYGMFHENRWYTLITSGFVHADLMHLLFNMLTFYFFAFKMEFDPVVGTNGLLILYFSSLIISHLPTAIKNRNNYDYRSLGASGAVSGIIFSYILFDPTSKMIIMFLPIPIPSPLFGILYLVYCWYAARHSNDLINHEAHLWGALCGIIMTSVMYPDIASNFVHYIMNIL
jgi:membrane associated rhomboid family serine protease